MTLKEQLHELKPDARHIPGLWDLLEDAGNTAGLYGKQRYRTGVAHIWDPIRRSLRLYQKGKAGKAKDIATKALLLVHRWHPEEIEEHEKTRAHHAAIGREREEMKFRKHIPHTPRDEMRAFLNTILAGRDKSEIPSEGFIEGDRKTHSPEDIQRLWRKAVNAGLLRSYRGNDVVTAHGRRYLVDNTMPKPQTTFGQILPYGEFRFDGGSLPGLWYKDPQDSKRAMRVNATTEPYWRPVDIRQKVIRNM